MLKDGNSIIRLINGLKAASNQTRRTIDLAPLFAKWAWEAGFVKVLEQQFPLPVGNWPKDKRLKEIGACLALSFHDGVPAFTEKPFKDVLGWRGEEVDVLNAQVRKAALDRSTHAFCEFVVVMGQKPG